MVTFTINRALVVAFAIGGVLGSMFGVVVTPRPGEAAAAATARVDSDLNRLKAAYRRPATVPFPADNPYSEKKRALGEALFYDNRLSIDLSRSPIKSRTNILTPSPLAPTPVRENRASNDAFGVSGPQCNR